MDKIEKLIDEAQEESLLVATCYDYIDKNGEHDTNWIMLNKAVETLKKIKQIVKEKKEERTFINYDKKKKKYLQEIKYMGKPLQETIGFNELLLGEWNVKDTRRYTGRVLTNWDYECNKAYDKVVINYATYYKHNTKKELYKMACDNRIASRSHMNKKQLIIALLKL